MRHLTAAQVAARTRLMLLRRWRRARGTRLRIGTAAVAAHEPLWRDLDAARLHPDAAPRLERARDLAAGRFALIGTTFTYERALPDWREPRASALWRYHLNYFDYVLDLALAGDFETFRRLAESWLRENGRIAGDCWHPYTVSLRVVNWCHALSAFGSAGAEEFRRTLAAATAAQAQFVYENLEVDVRGNHLLENLRALVWAGVVFGNDRWLGRGLRMLEAEVAEQVLGDGCHFERVPGYHLVVLRDLFEIRTFLERNRTVPAWLDDAVRRMSAFLRTITGPGDRLPLFKDTTRNDDFTPSDFLRADGWYSALCGTTVDAPPAAAEGFVFGPSGYAIVRDAWHLLVADYGIPCPDYLPAHAHADLFSFELTRDGTPLIVDSGVFAYQGEWRPWFRSTAAHNTVEVADENQSEVWGSFRVARRAKPERVQTVSDGRVHVIQGEHRGYARLTPAVTHRRTMLWCDGVLAIVDELFGDGRTRAKSRVHLHPNVTTAEVEVTPFGSVAATRERGWYSERFGSKVENDVLVFAADGALPLVFGYCVASPGAASATLTRDGDTPRLELRHAGRTITVQLPRHAPPLIE